MNKILYMVSFYAFISCSSVPVNDDATLYVNDVEFNFGKIPYKEEREHIIEFTNPGETPVVISEVKASCGCTGVDWTREPVKSGRKGQVKVKYDAAFPGIFEKTITVYYNGKDSPAFLRIKGQVAYPEDLEEPAE